MKRLIPAPSAIEEKDGVFDIENATVFYDCDIDFRLKKAAGTLAREMSEISQTLCPLSAASPSGKYINIIAEEGGGEGYRLTVETGHIVIEGAGIRGAFYGIQTLRQLIKLYGSQIPCCAIDDFPDLEMRGFYQDVTRGRVNTLEKLKKIADMLAFYKINSLQLYIEDAFLFKEFEGIITEDEALTAEEILELDSYCFDRFIELIPSLSTFGHLFTLLQSEKYNYLCELEGHRMTTNYWMEKQWHHTVNVYEPDTIKVIGSMIEQYMALFRSDKFNICCDETMDLCAGKNKGCDKGEAYFYHLSGLIDILKRHGKTVMIWGDECMARPEMTKKYLPADTIILNWCYHKTVNEWIPRFFSDLGFEQAVCPGTASWSKFIEDIDTSVGNITEFSAHAKKYGAVGLVNTNWGDFGHICSFNCNLYGTLFGAEKSWRVHSVTGEDFRQSAGLLLYGTTEIDVIETIYSLGRAELTCDWFRFVMWHSANCLEGRNTQLMYSEDGLLTADDAIHNIGVCKEEIKKLSSVTEGDKTVLEDLILAASAIKLMNCEYLYVNGVEGYTDGTALQAEFDSWLEKYKASWLRSDKPSQLWRLADFISHITEVPVKKR